MQVRLKENSWLAKLAARRLKTESVAMVFGRTIHLYGVSRVEFLRDRDWICHELTHVEQYRRYGTAGFLCRYLLESIRYGYEQNRFEEEARMNEKNERLLRDIQFS